ncbi:Serine/threonine-protein kinase HT1 [Hordeum vulgare]|nr:Serine/threonine-protein kinase HT1 [Hordeum vulgare]
MAALRCLASFGSIVSGAALDDRGRRWSDFVLIGALVEMSSHAWGDRCYVVSCLLDRCYARQIFQSLHVRMDERRTVAPLGVVVASTDGRTGKGDTDLSPENGTVGWIGDDNGF